MLINLKVLIEFFELNHQKNLAILNDYNLENGYINTMVYENCLNNFYPEMQNEFKRFKDEVDDYFSDYFYDDLIIEFECLYIKPYLDRISLLLTKLRSYKLREFLPVRPYSQLD